MKAASSLNRRFSSPFVVISILLAAVSVAFSNPIELTVQASQPGKAISPDLMGIFFEDLNYAADGGLYAELIQNRSFEYSPTEQSSWHPLSFWNFNDAAAVTVRSACPTHGRSI